jgi:hypothetical protein
MPSSSRPVPEHIRLCWRLRVGSEWGHEDIECEDADEEPDQAAHHRAPLGYSGIDGGYSRCYGPAKKSKLRLSGFTSAEKRRGSICMERATGVRSLAMPTAPLSVPSPVCSRVDTRVGSAPAARSLSVFRRQESSSSARIRGATFSMDSIPLICRSRSAILRLSRRNPTRSRNFCWISASVISG